jgi:hypothetical protein
MKPRNANPGQSIARCPLCEAPIHAPAGSRRRRVQCPRCREIVTIEKGATGGLRDDVPPPSHPDELGYLKARVETLEQALAQLRQAVLEVARGPRIRWIAAGAHPCFSTNQADALRGNLAALPAHYITIEARRGDPRARERAEWFKTIFTEARWSVRGPEDAPTARITRPGVSLATGLPVSAKAAATYLAVRAAGFDIATIFDAELGDDEPRLVVA